MTKDKHVEAQLQKIIAHKAFGPNSRLSHFLNYIVTETLAGRGRRLKAYSIAISVFDRDETFDPSTSSVVRVEANRLRSKLKQYYEEAGRHDPIVIAVPVGTYVPVFRTNPWSARLKYFNSYKLFHLVLSISITIIFIASVFFLHSNIEQKQTPSEIGDFEALDSTRKILVIERFEDKSLDQTSRAVQASFRSSLITYLSEFPELYIASVDSNKPSVYNRLPFCSLSAKIHKHPKDWYIAVQVTDPTTGFILWSHDYVLRGAETLEIKEIQRLAQNVATSIASPNGVLYKTVFTNKQRKK